MSSRKLTIILALIVLLLTISWWARGHYAKQQCEEMGLIFEPGKGCFEPPRGPAIILERGLKRT